MIGIEGYTEFNPPQIAVSESVYKLARKFDGRARMTLAHELGHLVMHPGASKMRTVDGNRTLAKVKPYQSAEWQARKFGAYFLLPTDIVMQFVTATDLAESCRVSFQAASIRFAEVGHIPPDAPAECVEDLIAKYSKD
jgi:Zn-dependent peptidase ImmA (M78 family)